jgi:hypothetical protein
MLTERVRESCCGWESGQRSGPGRSTKGTDAQNHPVYEAMKTPMKWYELLDRHWRSLGLQSEEGGANEGVIGAFESRFSILMPTELRLYFKHVNGMSMRGGHDVDDNGFSFLPLEKVQTVGAFSSEIGWTIGDGVGHKTAFVFVDYLQWCNAYAFETASQRAGAIYLLGNEEPKIVAPSMSEFAAMYLADDPLLCQSR